MEGMFVKADEIATDLGLSRSSAYEIIKKLNQELREKGYMTISGRVSRRFYEERFYALSQCRGGDRK